MSDSRFVEDSLEAVLVSIAEGVREAQKALNETPPLDTYGRPLPTYQLPYLDFEIEATMEAEKSATGGLMMILRKGVNNESVSVSSKLSGRLVAVPPGEGLPTTILTFTSTRLSARKHKLMVSAANTAGEVLIEQGIELNIDPVASKALSSVDGIALNDAQLLINKVGTDGGTRLTDMVLLTDENGNADTDLTIDPKIPAKATLVFSAEIGNAKVSLSVQAGGES